MSTKASIVNQLVSKLPPQEKAKFKLTKRINEKTQEQLRILATKARIGSLGKGDNENARAAAILELVARPHHKFPPEVLAMIAGSKKKAFQQLHRKVENYLSDYSSTTTTKAKKTSRKRKSRELPLQRTASGKQQKITTDDTTETAKAASHRPEDEAEEPQASSSTILDLAIRLGSIIPDSHGYATRAKQLLQDITKVIQASKPPPVRQAGLQDLHRHYPAYEAACFYAVAKASSTSYKRKRTTNRKQRQQQDTDDDENNVEEEEELNQLDINDIIRVSNVSEHVFLGVLPTVEQLAAKVTTLQQQKPAHKATSATTTQETQRKQAPPRQRHVYSDEFLKWKEETLANARKRARIAISIQHDINEDNITDGAATKHAANSVLRLHGLLHETN